MDALSSGHGLPSRVSRSRISRWDLSDAIRICDLTILAVCRTVDTCGLSLRATTRYDSLLCSARVQPQGTAHFFFFAM